MSISAISLTSIEVEEPPSPSKQIKKLVRFENLPSETISIDFKQSAIKSAKTRSRTPMPRHKKEIQDKKVK